MKYIRFPDKADVVAFAGKKCEIASESIATL